LAVSRITATKHQAAAEKALCARWIAAGNTAELAVYPGGVHGFTAFPGKLAAKANERIDRFMAEAASQFRST
jgi:acetyl esterase/lipase